jgi:NADH-ubiquinone oxidoreductase chain 1
MCILTSILFLGGYLLFNNLDYWNILRVIFNYNPIFLDWDVYIRYYRYIEYLINNPIIEGLLYGLSIGLKSSILIFIFIWVRASFPRIRFDQLMAFCWTVLLPILFALIVLVPCVLYSYNIFPANVYLF